MFRHGRGHMDDARVARVRSRKLNWITGTGRPPPRSTPAPINSRWLLREMSVYIELSKCDVNNIARLTCEYPGKSRGGVSCTHGPRDYERALYKTKPLTNPPGGRRIGASGGERDNEGVPACRFLLSGGSSLESMAPPSPLP